MESKSKYDFLDKIVIECPRCSSKASIDIINENLRRLSCPECGYLHEGHIYSIGDYNLWYETKVSGNRLYAYNFDHLEYIEKYIESILRSNEKTQNGWHNQSVENRLPKVFKKASNREATLKAIRNLKSK